MLDHLLSPGVEVRAAARPPTNEGKGQFVNFLVPQECITKGPEFPAWKVKLTHLGRRWEKD